MNPVRNLQNKTQTGFSMIEVLVTLIILLIGLLGLAGVMIQSQRSEMESYQRVQGLILLQDIVGRINANRKVASCYAFTTDTSAGTPYLGTLATAAPAACTTGTTAQNTQVSTDLTAWNDLLNGAAETSGGNVGAMIGARGCISYDNTTLLNDTTTGAPITGTGIYTVAVAWQGMGNTFAATPNCAQGKYGTNDASRRVVSLTFRTASLL